MWGFRGDGAASCRDGRMGDPPRCSATFCRRRHPPATLRRRLWLHGNQFFLSSSTCRSDVREVGGRHTGRFSICRQAAPRHHSRPAAGTGPFAARSIPRRNCRAAGKTRTVAGAAAAVARLRSASSREVLRPDTCPLGRPDGLRATPPDMVLATGRCTAGPLSNRASSRGSAASRRWRLPGRVDWNRVFPAARFAAKVLVTVRHRTNRGACGIAQPAPEDGQWMVCVRQYGKRRRD